MILTSERFRFPQKGGCIRHARNSEKHHSVTDARGDPDSPVFTIQHVAETLGAVRHGRSTKEQAGADEEPTDWTVPVCTHKWQTRSSPGAGHTSKSCVQQCARMSNACMQLGALADK